MNFANVYVNQFDLLIVSKLSCYVEMILCVFQVPYSELVNDVLIFAVYDFNRIMKHTLMGLVKVPMKTLNLKSVYTDFRDITSPELELENVCLNLYFIHFVVFV